MKSYYSKAGLKLKSIVLSCEVSHGTCRILSGPCEEAAQPAAVDGTSPLQ